MYWKKRNIQFHIQVSAGLSYVSLNRRVLRFIIILEINKYEQINNNEKEEENSCLDETYISMVLNQTNSLVKFVDLL